MIILIICLSAIFATVFYGIALADPAIAITLLAFVTFFYSLYLFTRIDQ